MAEIDISTLNKSLTDLGVPAAAVTKAIEAAAAAAKLLAEMTFEGLKENFSQLGVQAGKTSKIMDEVTNANNNITQSFGGVAKGIQIITALTSNFDPFKDFTTGGMAVQSLSSQFKNMVDNMGGWTSAASKLAGTGLSGLAKGSEAAAMKLLETADAAQKMETNYLNMLGAGTSFKDAFNETGQVVSNLDDKVLSYSLQLVDVAGQTNKTTTEVAQFATMLQGIPGVLESLIVTTEDGNRKMNGLSAALTLASGSGQSQKQVMDALKLSYENLANPQGKVIDSTKKGLEMFALMAEASTKLGLRFSDTEGYLSNVAKTFALIGDNSMAATNILAMFSGSLQETGLTATQSVGVIGRMVDSISHLSIGTKALISARNGGPGGLQGAFKIDNLMREGKTDEVAKMLEKTFKQQVGGRIYSQKEAEQSPQAAAAFMKQRSILHSGAFGGLGKGNEAEETRILEAMAKGPAELGKVIKNPMQAMQDVTNHGISIQDKQATLLNKANTALEKGNLLAQQHLLLAARQAIGNAMGPDGKSQAAGIIKTYSNDSGDDSLKLQKSDMTLDEQQDAQGINAGKDAISAFGSISTGIFNKGREVTEEVWAGAKKSGEAVTKLAKERSNIKTVEAGQRKTQQAIKNATQPQPNIGNGVNQIMNAAPRLNPSMQMQPVRPGTMKHEITLNPLAVQVNVTSDPGMKATVVTNYDPGNPANKAINSYEEKRMA